MKNEDLVASIELQLPQICDLLEIEFEPSMVNPQANLQHVTSGNCMWFSANKSIELDTTWMTRLYGEQAAYFDRHAGDLNHKLGHA